MYDIPLNAQLAFQNAGSVIATGIEHLHHAIFFVLILIFIPILCLLWQIVYRYAYKWEHLTKDASKHIILYRKNYLTWNALIHGIYLEIIWTVTPTICLVLIALPSFGLLYSIDEIIEPLLTYKVIGHQWYWSYETPTNEEFSSYLKPVTDLQKGELRLLEVDQPLICPIYAHIRVIVTAIDVLHSFAIPSLGIKIDAVPGRLNQVSLFLLRPGIFYGQCSELCGVNHGFMPIKIIALEDLIPMAV
jgi:cytochrome c oxidase subunit 2